MENDPTHFPKSDRHEILEERANRDAFRLCVMMFVIVALVALFCGYQMNWIRQRHEFLNERQDALERWGAHVEGLLREGEIVELKAAS